jgi:hypothetical protein
MLCAWIKVGSGDLFVYRSREWISERIRRDRRLDPMVSQRTLAQRYRVSRKTVVKALSHPVPPVRKPPPPRVSVLKPVEGLHRRDAVGGHSRKQRHTINRILQRLATERDFEQASYSTVRDYVRKRRPEIDRRSGPRRSRSAAAARALRC